MTSLFSVLKQKQESLEGVESLFLHLNNLMVEIAVQFTQHSIC